MRTFRFDYQSSFLSHTSVDIQWFSDSKVKNLLKFDAPDLDASDPFPFLFDGDDMDGGPDTKLRVFPASELIGDLKYVVCSFP